MQNARTLCAGDWSEQVVAKALRTLDSSGESLTNVKTYWEDEEMEEESDLDEAVLSQELEQLDSEEGKPRRPLQQQRASGGHGPRISG